MNKEIEGKRKLNQQIIDSLRSKIKEQEEFIKQMTQKTNEAGNQVQAIALKALEGSTAFRTYCVDDGKKTSQSSQER